MLKDTQANINTKPDLMYDIVKYAVDTRYSDLPSEVTDFVKKVILDTIAVTVAGSSQAGIKPVVELVQQWGGKPESTIIVYGGKYPAPMAALAIGPMCRALDLGEVHPYGSHMSEYILPALFPLVEYRNGVNGKDFVLAYTLGLEVMARIGASVTSVAPQIKTGRMAMWRIWGPTLAGAKLLNLNLTEMWNAMGISYSQAAGDLQRGPDGALTIRVEHGLTACAALKSIFLAQKGITGARNILQGKYGFYNAFEPNRDESLVTKELGKSYQCLNSTLKMYPACGFTLGAIDGTIAILREHKIKPEDISKIDVGLSSIEINYVCQPAELKYNPQTTVDCQFSLPYVVACAALNGKLSLNDFQEANIWRKDVRNFMKKIVFHLDPSLDSASGLQFGAKVDVETVAGKKYFKDCTIYEGSPGKRASWEDIMAKWYMCAGYAARPIPGQNVEEIAKACRNLEKVEDVTQIITLLSPP